MPEENLPEKIKVGGVIQNSQLASISVLSVKDRPGIAAAILDALGRRNLNVQFIVQVIDHENHDQTVICVDRADLTACLETIDRLRPELQPAAVVAQPEVASIAIFGPDFRERPGIAGRMFKALAEQQINILAISTSISTVNCIIDLARLPDAYATLCRHFDIP
ncbi:MAG: Aspartokinase [Chloroflexi bacterium ADurb.Bin325]|nr:MAG: Aspartokinase [Chloroflexi bacterium ADurb.Bin325]